jgi:hypothetical protein
VVHFYIPENGRDRPDDDDDDGPVIDAEASAANGRGAGTAADDLVRIYKPE